MEDIKHYELCKLTAEWQLKKHKIILWEYQNTATLEYPDVLCFKNGYTRLFEIKVSRQDFLKDFSKQCRVEKKLKYFPRFDFKRRRVDWESWIKPEMKEFYTQMPHLGRERYYVCPKGLIKKEEIKNGFGLYYWTGKGFRIQKKSESFKANIYEEMRIMEHAFRRYHSEGIERNIMINGYEPK